MQSGHANVHSSSRSGSDAKVRQSLTSRLPSTKNWQPLIDTSHSQSRFALPEKTGLAD